MDKRIVILLVIIAILAAALGYMIFQQNSVSDVKNTTANTTVNTTVKNTTVVNETEEDTSQETVSGEYGYCAVCGRALSYDEAHNEYTQGKVCSDCASNPYYQTDEGADYANEKLKEAYPDDYEGMFEDSPDDIDNKNTNE